MVVATACLLVAGACGRDSEPTADIALDGSPRVPDRSGIVGRVTLEHITIDGEKLELSKKLLAFSTYTLAAMPVLQTDDAYVHAGVKDGKVVWVALVSQPLRDGRTTTAFYTGTVKRKRSRTVEFVDGTVLRTAPDVVVPAAGSELLIEIDVRRDVVTKVSGA